MPTPMDAGYVMVAERHSKFVEDHPDGRIETRLVSSNYDAGLGKGFVVVEAKVWKNKGSMTDGYGLPPDGTGLSSMPIPGLTSFTRGSEVENCETSAVGRALAMIGYHAKETMASKDEIDMKKPDSTVVEDFKAAVEAGSPDLRDATPAQKAKVMSWGKKLLGDEKAVRAFVKKEVGVFKSADLTRDHIDKLFAVFKVLEASGGTLDGISDE